MKKNFESWIFQNSPLGNWKNCSLPKTRMTYEFLICFFGFMVAKKLKETTLGIETLFSSVFFLYFSWYPSRGSNFTPSAL